MRVLVCGDRHWCDGHAIMEEIRRFNPTVLIHGDARGADTLASEAALALEIPIEAYPAQWEKYGRAAGPIRNKQMLDEGKPDLVLAFHADLEKSRGTKNMVNQARKAGIPVRVFGV